MLKISIEKQMPKNKKTIGCMEDKLVVKKGINKPIMLAKLPQAPSFLNVELLAKAPSLVHGRFTNSRLRLSNSGSILFELLILSPIWILLLLISEPIVFTL